MFQAKDKGKKNLMTYKHLKDLLQKSGFEIVGYSTAGF